MKNYRISNIPEMDRLRGRQILTYLLLRSEEQQFRHGWRPHSVPDSQSEHRRIHGFAIGKIHGSNQRIVFLLVHGRGLDSTQHAMGSIGSGANVERQSSRSGPRRRTRQLEMATHSACHPGDARHEKGRPGVAADQIDFTQRRVGRQL